MEYPLGKHRTWVAVTACHRPWLAIAIVRRSSAGGLCIRMAKPCHAHKSNSTLPFSSFQGFFVAVIYCFYNSNVSMRFTCHHSVSTASPSVSRGLFHLVSLPQFPCQGHVTSGVVCSRHCQLSLFRAPGVHLQISFGQAAKSGCARTAPWAAIPEAREQPGSARW